VSIFLLKVTMSGESFRSNHSWHHILHVTKFFNGYFE
jgi:hypothetical protein